METKTIIDTNGVDTFEVVQKTIASYDGSEDSTNKLVAVINTNIDKMTAFNSDLSNSIETYKNKEKYGTLLPADQVNMNTILENASVTQKIYKEGIDNTIIALQSRFESVFNVFDSLKNIKTANNSIEKTIKEFKNYNKSSLVTSLYNTQIEPLLDKKFKRGETFTAGERALKELYQSFNTLATHSGFTEYFKNARKFENIQKDAKEIATTLNKELLNIYPYNVISDVVNVLKENGLPENRAESYVIEKIKELKTFDNDIIFNATKQKITLEKLENDKAEQQKQNENKASNVESVEPIVAQQPTVAVVDKTPITSNVIDLKPLNKGAVLQHFNIIGELVPSTKMQDCYMLETKEFIVIIENGKLTLLRAKKEGE